MLDKHFHNCHFHFYASDVSEQLLIIIKNQNKMSDLLESIKADLMASHELVKNVGADVNLLHEKLAALEAGQISQEQLDELKGLSGNLVERLTVVDEKTAAAPADGNGSGTGEADPPVE